MNLSELNLDEVQTPATGEGTENVGLGLTVLMTAEGKMAH